MRRRQVIALLGVGVSRPSLSNLCQLPSRTQKQTSSASSSRSPPRRMAVWSCCRIRQHHPSRPHHRLAARNHLPAVYPCTDGSPLPHASHHPIMSYPSHRAVQTISDPAAIAYLTSRPCQMASLPCAAVPQPLQSGCCPLRRVRSRDGASSDPPLPLPRPAQGAAAGMRFAAAFSIPAPPTLATLFLQAPAQTVREGAGCDETRAAVILDSGERERARAEMLARFSFYAVEQPRPFDQAKVGVLASLRRACQPGGPWPRPPGTCPPHRGDGTMNRIQFYPLKKNLIRPEEAKCVLPSF